MTDIINEEENTTPLPEEEQETVVVDNGQTYESTESAIIAKEEADKAKLWAQESERQANLASGSADIAAQARDDAVAAKEYAEAAVTDANVVAVGTDLRAIPSYIKTVANNISDVSTVAGVSSDVSTVAGISSDVTIVADNSTDINTVATSIINVNKVATDISNVNYVAEDLVNIDAVNANKTNIDTVASVSSDISTVASVYSDVSTVAGIDDDVTAVASNATDISTVAANNTNVTAVANNVSDINSVATNITNVNTTATNINAINTAATNIVAIQNAPVNAQLARDWAVKMDGLVSGEDYSAKYYADQARQAASGAVVDGITINRNTDDELQTIGVINQNNTTTAVKTWTGTRAQYDAIVSKDSNTLYNITDDTDTTLTLLEALYPVGSIYITTASTCPLSTLISGSSWQLVSSGRVLQGADSGHSAGTTIEAGLPNITGDSKEMIFRNGNYNSRSGCLNYEYIGQYWDSNAGGSYQGDRYELNFDASQSNSIYGNSDTVQPPAYVVNIFRRIL